MSSSLSNFRGQLLNTLLHREVDVLAAAPFFQDDVALSESLTISGAKAINIPLFRGSLNPLRDATTLYALYRAMRTAKPNWVLSYTIKPVIWGSLAAKLARVPHRAALITGLGYAFTGDAGGRRALTQRLARFLYRLALSGSDVVFFQNPDDRNLFNKLGLLKNIRNVVVVNGSGIDLEHFSPQPAPYSTLPLRFLLIARLLRDKGVAEYVQAAKRVRTKFPTAEFHIVGDVDVNPNSFTRSEIEAWHQAGDIIWHGHQNDVRPWLANCHVYVLPSYREGTPRSVLEAMATGRPVITTDAPGCRETVIDGHNGYLVPVQDIEALACAMLRFCEQPNLLAPMGKASLQLARDKYDVHKVNAVMLKAMGL